MKKLLISAVALLLIVFTAKGQTEKSDIETSDTSKTSKEKGRKNQLDLQAGPLKTGSIFIVPDKGTRDPFVRYPRYDSVGVKPVDIPNAYIRSADRSVDIPTYSSRIRGLNIQNIEMPEKEKKVNKKKSRPLQHK